MVVPIFMVGIAIVVRHAVGVSNRHMAVLMMVILVGGDRSTEVGDIVHAPGRRRACEEQGCQRERQEAAEESDRTVHA
jgi:hypothetical protein